jgi:lysophospholipase
MLENLGKTVIVTGSQVPLSEFRNDAVDNLLNSLIIAGHFVIPEVGLCFDNKLFRGNRCSKVNALDFSAFDSPNLRALVNIGINIDVSWQDVWKPSEIDRFVAHKVMQPNVASLRLFPGITESTVRAFFAPHILGVVLETYGSGNAPTNRTDLLDIIKEACDNGIVVVNCSQCKKGLVTDIYATGKALLKIGVIPGG